MDRTAADRSGTSPPKMTMEGSKACRKLATPMPRYSPARIRRLCQRIAIGSCLGYFIRIRFPSLRSADFVPASNCSQTYRTMAGPLPALPGVPFVHRGERDPLPARLHAPVRRPGRDIRAGGGRRWSRRRRCPCWWSGRAGDAHVPRRFPFSQRGQVGVVIQVGGTPKCWLSFSVRGKSCHWGCWGWPALCRYSDQSGAGEAIPIALTVRSAGQAASMASPACRRCRVVWHSFVCACGWGGWCYLFRMQPRGCACRRYPPQRKRRGGNYTVVRGWRQWFVMGGTNLQICN